MYFSFHPLNKYSLFIGSTKLPMMDKIKHAAWGNFAGLSGPEPLAVYEETVLACNI